MRVLVACECSGRVRDAFAARGHDAWSCDLQPSDTPGKHLQCDVLTVLDRGWDLMIAHPDCTYLAVSGLHWNHRVPGRSEKTESALNFVRTLMEADVPRICIENPVSCISSRIRKPDQIIQPWHFGDDASKATCLWLKNLPLLRDTNRLPGDNRTRRANQTPSGQNKLGPSPLRKKLRAMTYPGIAAAMADQWGSLPSRVEAINSKWNQVVFSCECDEYGNCPNCGIDYADCGCPGPTQDGMEYLQMDGILYARQTSDMQPLTIGT